MQEHCYQRGPVKCMYITLYMYTYHDYIITWDIQLKTALTFKTIIIEGNELSGGISLTLWSVFGI